jgi:signal transduction histidine kinase
MVLLKKSFRFSWIALVATVMLLSSCDNALQSHDSDFDRVHNIMRYSDSIPRTVDSLMALGEINQMCADFYNMSYYISRDLNRSCVIADSALARPVVTERDRIYHFLIAANNSELDCASRHYESGLRKAQQLVNSVDTSFINRHYLLQTGYLLAYSNLAVCYINLERFAEGEKYMQQVMTLIDQFEKTSVNDSVAQHNWASKRTQFAVAAMISFCNMHQWDRAKAWMNRAEKSLQDMANNPRVDKSHYPMFCYQVSCVKAYILEKAGHHQEAALAYEEFMKNPFSKSVVARINSVSYLNSSHRYEEAERNINDVETVIGQVGLKMDLETLNGIVKLKFDAHLGAGHRDSALAVATRILARLDSAEVWQRRDKTAELATIYDMSKKDAEIAEKEAKLNQMRIVVLLIVIVLLLVFFFIYAFTRRRAAASLNQKNEQLLVANARAEEASRMKTKFIQQISHEFRTPLNVLSGFAQVLTDSDAYLDENVRQDANHQILENTNRITNLVNKMLELSDVSSRTVLNLTDQVTVEQVATDAVDASGIADADHLAFEMQTGDEASSVRITTNKRAAVRALALLLDNARKFTAPAEAYGHHDTADKKQRAVLKVSITDTLVQFIVEDTGIGVPADQAERIFDEFVQLDEYYDGTGIGLTVARSFARRLGGDVRLDTTYTAGARFVMTLPRK